MMTPEYVEGLADTVDPEQLWKLSFRLRKVLSDSARKQLDAGIALRRYAHHLRALQSLKPGKSLLYTPLSFGGMAVMTVPMPPSHAKLLDMRSKAE